MLKGFLGSAIRGNNSSPPIVPTGALRDAENNPLLDSSGEYLLE